MSSNYMPVGLWLETQHDMSFGDAVPEWAQQVASAHQQQSIVVLAHPATAYARAGLACDVQPSEVGDDVFWQHLHQAVGHARQIGAQKIILIMPSSANGAMCAKALLMELQSHDAQLDEVLAIMSLAGEWGGDYEDPIIGALTDKLLMADRVLSFGDVHLKTDFVRHMKTVNPMAQWLDGRFSVDGSVELPCRAYVAAAPLWLEPLKTKHLNAWTAQEVVYFTFAKPIEGVQLKAVLDRWRVEYGLNLMRLQAVVYLKGEPSPLCIQALQDLWTDEFVGFWQHDETPKTAFWMHGNHLPWVQMETEIADCMAG